MKVCVIGGANVDITAVSETSFRPGDSHPGRVRLSLGGVGRNIAHNLVLLGHQVCFLTVFGDDVFGRLTQDGCRKAGLDVSRCETVAGSTGSCFVSINDNHGEMTGGVADMGITERMTPAWLEARLDCLRKADVVVADANLSARSLAFLLDNCPCPLYLDAVSGAKAPRLKEALALARVKTFFALKCNLLEASLLAPLPPVNRCYISRGAEGVEVREAGREESILVPAVPCVVKNVTGAGDALLAGIVHMGPSAPAVDAARFGVRCAKEAAECELTVNESIKKLI